MGLIFSTPLYAPSSKAKPTKKARPEARRRNPEATEGDFLYYRGACCSACEKDPRRGRRQNAKDRPTAQI